MVFENFGKKESFEDFESQVDTLSKQNELLQSSVDFLTKKITDFKNNGKLEKYEIDFIKEQIKYHKKLSVLKKKYTQGKNSLTHRSIREIDAVYHETEGTAISKIEINYLKGKTKKEELKLKDTLRDISYRDYIEENVNITRWPESIFEGEKVRDFYNLFTLEYLNYIENFYSEEDIRERHNNIKNGLVLPKKIIKGILYRLLNNNWRKLIDLNNDLIINIGGKKERFSIKDIKGEINTDKIEKTRVEKEIMKAEKEKKEKIHRMQLLDEILIKINNFKGTIKKIGQVTPLQKNETAKIVKEKLIKYLIISGTLEKSKISSILIIKNGFDDANFAATYEKILKENGQNKKVKKIDKEYAILLLENLLDNINDLNLTREKTVYISNNIEISVENEYLFIDYLLRTGEITKDQLLQKSEKFESFNYLNFIDRYGLSEEVENTYIQFLTRKIKNLNVYINGKVIKITPEFVQENQAIIINNLTVLNKIIVGIESDGINKDNHNGSGAKGYFQFHTANGASDRNEGKYNSFETALRRAYKDLSGFKYIPNQEFKNHDNVPQWIVDAYNNKNTDPKDLTASQQNSLFVIDMFNNGKKVINGMGHKKGIPDYIGLAIIGNLWSVEKFYKLFHHTAPDKATIKRIKDYSKKYTSEFTQID
ncbi:MAG: hypothetical protein QM490_03195 [Candidatus Gracilibacteria bacterium]